MKFFKQLKKSKTTAAPKVTNNVSIDYEALIRDVSINPDVRKNADAIVLIIKALEKENIK